MENRPHGRRKNVGEGSVSAQKGRKINTGGPVGGNSQKDRPEAGQDGPRRESNPYRAGGGTQRGGSAAKAAGLAALLAIVPKKFRGIVVVGILVLVALNAFQGGSEELPAPAATAKPTAKPAYTIAPQNEDLESIDGTNMMFTTDSSNDWTGLFGSLFGVGDSYSGYYPESGSSTGGLLQDLPGAFSAEEATPVPVQTAAPKPTAAVSGTAAEIRDKRVKPLGGGMDTVTVMVYMCGTDLESKYGMATSDLTEMTKARLSDKVNVIVETGGCKNWKNSVVSSQYNQIYRVHNGGMERLESNFGNAAMTEPATLSKFIQYCSKNYPADRNILILWDHGGGSISGYGYDEKNGRDSSMTLPKIDQALTDAGVVFDWIGYDACLMSTLETALVSAKYADYLIASEEVEPGTGWYYTDWLNALSKNTSIETEALGKTLIDSYVGACRQKSYNAQVTLALTDLAELESMIPSAFRDFSVSTNGMISSDGYRTVSQARAGARQFAQSTRINQVDLADLALRIGSEEGKALAQTIQDCVKYNGTTITKCYGLSIYFPYESMSSVSSAVNTYDTLGLDEEYAKVIKSFASMEYGGQIGSAASQGSYSGSSSWDSYFGSSGGYGDYGSLLETLLGGYSYAGSSSYGGSAYGSASPAGAFSDSYYNSYGQSSAGYSIDAYDLVGLLSAFTGRSMPADRAWVDTELIADKAESIAENFLEPGRICISSGDSGNVLSLTDSEWSLVQTVELNIFADDGKGYVDLGLDNVFEMDGNDLLLDYDQTWLTMDGQLVAYYLVSDSENPDGSWTTIGRIPAILNGDLVNLQVIFNDENPDGAVTGAYPFYQNGETETSPKGLVPLKDGDTLEFVCDYYTYDGSYENSYTLGEKMTVSGEPVLQNLKLENDVISSFRITDIYGNHYWLKF